MRAPRQHCPAWQQFVRGALWGPVLWLASAGLASAQGIVAAEYATPTSEYPHAVLGDALEWAHLDITVQDGTDGATKVHRIAAGTDLVFEDIAPRLWDMTADGDPEVVVVQSHQLKGARLLVLGLEGGKPVPLAATPHIGTRFRWLAPVGAADMDGDGHIEIGFVDRPHLAKTLRLWRYTPDSFEEIATLGAVTNHRIGENYISGGVRMCDDTPEFVLADAWWARILSVRFDGSDMTATDVAPFRGRASMGAALNC